MTIALVLQCSWAIQHCITIEIATLHIQI